MEAYDLIRTKLVDFSKIEEDKIFIQFLIVEKCVVLLDFSQSMISNYRGALTPPLLREVFEYTFILAGLEEFVSLNEFINHDKSDRFVKKIRDKIEDYALKKERDEKNIYKQFTKIIYDLLSEHTHANVDNLMRFSIDRFSNSKEKDIFKDDAEILFNLVNCFFLKVASSLLKLDLKVELLNSDDIHRFLNRLKPDKIESNEVYNRILSINAIKLRYASKFGDFKNDIHKYQNNKE